MFEAMSSSETRRQVWRGVPSQQFPELLGDRTWFWWFEDAVADAPRVVPAGESAYVEAGDAYVVDMQDINEREGLVTIEDGLVDVRHLIPVA
jgi:hypothetical protein